MSNHPVDNEKESCVASEDKTSLEASRPYFQFTLLEFLCFSTVIALAARSVAKFGPPVLLPTLGIVFASLNYRGHLRWFQLPKVRRWGIALNWGVFVWSMPMRFLELWDAAEFLSDFHHRWFLDKSLYYRNHVYVAEMLNLANVVMFASPILMLVWGIRRVEGFFVTILCVVNGNAWGVIASPIYRDYYMPGFYVWCFSLLLMLCVFRVRRINYFTVFLAMSASMMAMYVPKPY